MNHEEPTRKPPHPVGQAQPTPSRQHSHRPTTPPHPSRTTPTRPTPGTNKPPVAPPPSPTGVSNYVQSDPPVLSGQKSPSHQPLASGMADGPTGDGVTTTPSRTIPTHAEAESQTKHRQTTQPAPQGKKNSEDPQPNRSKGKNETSTSLAAGAAKSASARRSSQNIAGTNRLQTARNVAQNLKGDGEDKTVKQEIKDTTKDTLKGAAKGLKAGPKGAIAGGAKGLGQSLMSSKRVRKWALIMAVPAILFPIVIFGVVAALVMSVAAGVIVSEQDDFQAQELQENSNIEADEMWELRNAASTTGVPWQVLAAIEIVRSEGGSAPSGIASVIEPDGMTCPETGLHAEDGLSSNALLVLRCGKNEFPQIKTWGGVGERPNNPKSDHATGHAVDIMVPDWDTSSGNSLGWDIAEWYKTNAEVLGVKYVIFDREIWTGGAIWESYTHPSGDMSNPNVTHENHVHVSVSDEAVNPAAVGAASQTAGSGFAGLGYGSIGGPHAWPVAQSASAKGDGGIALGGLYGFSEDADISQEDAEDIDAATAYLAGRLEPLLEEYMDHSVGRDLGTGVVIFEDGTMEIAVAGEEDGAEDDDADTGGENRYVSDFWDERAQEVRDTYIQALSDPSSHLGMDEGEAARVFDVAMAIYMGKALQTSACTPAPSASGDDGLDDSDTGDDVEDTDKSSGSKGADSDKDSDEDEGGGKESTRAGLPTSLTVGGGSSQEITLNGTQISHASEIIGAGNNMNVGERGIKIALMTALQESALKNYANDGSSPNLTKQESEVVLKSMDIPHDAVGNDWDSVGLFQQRPSAGWGTVEDLMTPSHSAEKFYEALLKVDGWEGMDLAEAAQAVQVSAFPDAYAKWDKAAADILANVDGSSCGVNVQFSAEGWTHPVPSAKGDITSKFSPNRVNPFTGRVAPHNGTDLKAPPGTPILAAQDGVVLKTGGCVSGCTDPDYGLSGYLIALDHGDGVQTTYNHMQKPTERKVGEKVKAGDVIGYVGSTGNSTGPHLHFSVLTGPKQWVDPEIFMADVGVPL